MSDSQPSHFLSADKFLSGRFVGRQISQCGQARCEEGSIDQMVRKTLPPVKSPQRLYRQSCHPKLGWPTLEATDKIELTELVIYINL